MMSAEQTPILNDRLKAQHFRRTITLQFDSGSETLRKLIEKKLLLRNQTLKWYLRKNEHLLIRELWDGINFNDPKLFSMDITLLSQILLYTPIGLSRQERENVFSLREYRNELAHSTKAALENDSLYIQSKIIILHLANAVSRDWLNKTQSAIKELEKRELLSCHSNLERVIMNKEIMMVKLVEASESQGGEEINYTWMKYRLLKWTRHLSRRLNIAVFLKKLKDNQVITDAIKAQIDLTYNYGEQIHKLVLHIISESDTSIDILLRFCKYLRECSSQLADLIEDNNTDGRAIDDDLEEKERTKIRNILKEHFQKDETKSVASEDVHLFVEEKLGLTVDFSVIEKSLVDVFAILPLKENDSRVYCVTRKKNADKKEGVPRALNKEEELTDYKQFATYLGNMLDKLRPGLKETIKTAVLKESITANIFIEMTQEDIDYVFSKRLPPGVEYGYGIQQTFLKIQSSLKKRLNPTEYAVGEGYLRRFDTPTGHLIYKKCQIRPATGNCLIPGHAFVSLSDENETLHTALIVKEVIKFSAAFMNGTKNGTIHFGIKNSSDGTGSIVGLPKSKCCNPELLDFEIMKGIELCYKQEQIAIAKLCVRPVQFVPVEDDNIVIEIDIIPFSGHLENEGFEIQFPPKGKQRKLCVMFINELQPVEISFLKNSYTQMIEQRCSLEFEYLKYDNTSANGNRLVDTLTSGNRYVTDVFYPIICCGNITGSYDEDEIREKLQMDSAFTSSMAIFDFDSSTSLRNKVEKGNSQFKVRLAEDFVCHQKESVLSNAAGIGTWIYCNGNTDLNQDKMDFETWNKNRLDGVKLAISKCRQIIPKGRALVIFIVFGKSMDRDPMLEIARESFLSLFRDECVVISEADDTLEFYKKELSSLLGYQTIEKCFITGLKWGEISEIMTTVFRVDPNVTCRLPNSVGLSVDMTGLEKEEQHFIDIDIVSGEQCQFEDRNMSDDEKRKKRNDEAEHFYKGNKVSWWNIYFENQVGRRNMHTAHQHDIEMILQCKQGKHLVEVHEIQHYPAAGGTTLGMHLIWHFSQFQDKFKTKNAYRCCVVNSITEGTVDEIEKLRNFKDKNPKPFLVLVDNATTENVNLLQSRLEELAYKISSPGQLFCLILLITRVPMSMEPQMADRSSKHVILDHHLTEKEQHWFEAKFEELEQKKEINVKTLIAFNVMRHSFSPRFIRETAHSLLKSVKEKEMQLLKCLSLINTYESGQTVPESVFDDLMSENQNPLEPLHNRPFGIIQPLRQRMKNFNRETWNVSMTDSLAVLITKRANRYEKVAYYGSGVCVVSQLLAKEIHEYIKDTYHLTLDEVIRFVLDLVKDHSYQDNHASKQFKAIVSSLFKTRSFVDTKKGETKTKFSEMVTKLQQNVFEEEEENVTNSRVISLMKQCVDVTQDAMVGQQLARFNYILVKDFKAAEEAIQLSLHQQPYSQYLLDTFGQIYKSNMEYLISSVDTTDNKINDCHVKHIVKLAFQALDKFKEGQDAAFASDDVNNLWCCEMYVKTALVLLEKFDHFQCYVNRENLHHFLNDSSFSVETSSFKNICDSTRLAELRSGHPIQRQVNVYLRSLEERRYQVKFKMHDTESNTRLVLKFRERYEKLFGTNALRQKYQFKYGLNLKNLMIANDNNPDLLTTRVEEATNNILHKGLPSSSREDLLVYLGHAIIRLSSEDEDYMPGAKEYDILLKYSTKLVESQRNSQRPYLEAFLYHAILHWPSKSNIHLPSICGPKLYETVLSEWEQAFTKNHNIQNTGQIKMNKPKTYFALGAGPIGKYIIDMEWIRKQWKDIKKENEGRTRKPVYADDIWNDPLVDQRTEHMHGILDAGGKTVCYQADYVFARQKFRIKTYYPSDHLGNRKVTFVLGFTWNGIRAFNVKEKLNRTHVVDKKEHNVGDAGTSLAITPEGSASIDSIHGATVEAANICGTHVYDAALEVQNATAMIVDDISSRDDTNRANADAATQPQLIDNEVSIISKARKVASKMPEDIAGSDFACGSHTDKEFNVPHEAITTNTKHEWSSIAPERPVSPQISFPLKNEFAFKFVCRQCFQIISGDKTGYRYELLVVGHTCIKDVLVIRKKTETSWTRVRYCPDSMSARHRPSRLCRNIAKGKLCKVGEDKCCFPHHQIEMNLWNMDWQGEFSIKAFITQWSTFILMKRKHKAAEKASCAENIRIPNKTVHDDGANDKGVYERDDIATVLKASNRLQHKESTLDGSELKCVNQATSVVTKANTDKVSTNTAVNANEDVKTIPTSVADDWFTNEEFEYIPELSEEAGDTKNADNVNEDGKVLLETLPEDQFTSEEGKHEVSGDAVHNQMDANIICKDDVRKTPETKSDESGVAKGGGMTLEAVPDDWFTSEVLAELADISEDFGVEDNINLETQNTNSHTSASSSLELHRPKESIAVASKPSVTPVLEVLSEINFPLMDGFNFNLVCCMCFQKIGEGVKGYRIVSKKHVCSKDILIIKEKNPDGTDWVKVRGCPVSITTTQMPIKKCRHFAKGKPCKSGENSCIFAHHQADIVLWTMERYGTFCLDDFISQWRTHTFDTKVEAKIICKSDVEKTPETITDNCATSIEQMHEAFDNTDDIKLKSHNTNSQTSSSHRLHDVQESISIASIRSISPAIEVFPEIHFPLHDNFDFNCVCYTCFQKIGEGVNGYRLVSMEHSCSKDVFIIKEKNMDGANWVKVRECPISMITTNSPFKMCGHFTKGKPCKHGENKCIFAHHQAEMDLWTMERNETFCLADVISQWKTHTLNTTMEVNVICTSDVEEMAKTISETVMSMDKIHEAYDDSGCTRNADSALENYDTTLETIPEDRFTREVDKHKQSSDSVNKQMEANVICKGDVGKTPETLTDENATSIKTIHDDKVDVKGEGMTLETVPEDWFTSKELDDLPNVYEEFNVDVDKKMEAKIICKSDVEKTPETITNNCATSIEQMHEAFDNTDNIKLKSHSTNSYTSSSHSLHDVHESIVIASIRSISPSVEEIHFPLNDNFDFNFVCNSCFQKIGEGVKGYRLGSKEHYCSKDVFIIKERNMDGADWVKVRECPNSMLTTNNPFRMCGHFAKGKPCKHGENKCMFAHHQAEMDLWTMERNDTFCLADVISHWKSHTLNTTMEANVICKSDVEQMPETISETGTSMDKIHEAFDDTDFKEDVTQTPASMPEHLQTTNTNLTEAVLEHSEDVNKTPESVTEHMQSTNTDRTKEASEDSANRITTDVVKMETPETPDNWWERD